MDEEALNPPVKRFCLEDSSSSSEDIQFLTTESSPESDGLDSDSTYFFPSEDEKYVENEPEPFVSSACSLPCTLAVVPSNTQNELLESIAQVLISECCSKLCVRDLTVNSLLFAQRKFMSLGCVAQRQWITDKIHESSEIAPDGELITKFVVAGREVCERAFCDVHGFSTRRLSRIRKNASLGQVTIQHGNLGRKRTTAKVEEAKVWMNRYFHLIGDKQPDKTKIHLPSWETQHAIYDRYKEDMGKLDIPEDSLVGLSTFYRVWHEDFSNVTIPEVSKHMYIHFVYCL